MPGAPWWQWFAVVACTHAATPAIPSEVPVRSGPTRIDPLPTTRDKPPTLEGTDADPEAIRKAYLEKVAAQFQRGWRQFLTDCRLRLPASHALNQMKLAATADLAIDRSGRVVGVQIAAPSGNSDFDRAVMEVIADPSPLAVPPVELLSDDDLVHLRWLFARDLRQAGPATAEIVYRQLPVAGVVARLIDAEDLPRAARRIAVAPRSAERDDATRRVMVAALRLALRGLDGTVRRAAVEAIGRSRAVELVADVRSLLTVTSDADLRSAAIAAAAELNDVEAVPAILAQFPDDLANNAQLALAATQALVRLGHADDAAVTIRRALAAGAPNPIALEAFAVAPSFGIERKLDRWYARGNSRVRSAVCAALAGVTPAQAARPVRRGLSDRDATVRAACAATAMRLAVASPSLVTTLANWLRPLVHDRDRGVRARAIEAVATLDPARRVDASNDLAPEVRAAYARALPISHPDLHTLVADRDPEVRAAAWARLASVQTERPELSQLALQAVRDSSLQVQLAAIHTLDDLDALGRIANNEDTPELRTEGLVRLARKRGRAQISPLLLERLAASSPGSAERVRVALAWLLAT